MVESFYQHAHRQRPHKFMSEKYFIPYFGDALMNDMPDAFVEQYWDWLCQPWPFSTGLARRLYPSGSGHLPAFGDFGEAPAIVT